MSLFSLSGGLFYHLKALRYASSLWVPFRRHVAEWLQSALPPRDELVLVGPSAGHCLPLAQLDRFERLYVLEPDPLARRWLAARLRHSRIHAEHRDLLVEPLLSRRSGLGELLDRHPRASVLFCDLLGQVQLELSDEKQLEFQSAFRDRILPRLQNRCWASFHDRWSLDRRLDEPPLPSRVVLEHAPSDDELAEAWLGPTGAKLTVLDHGTRELFPAPGPRRYFAWQIAPRALHLVEAVNG